MTAHDIHDALTLLPADLITAADKVRTAPKTTVIHWRRWVCLAAVLALVIGTTLVFERNIGIDNMKQESAVAEAPAAAAPMAPAPMEDEIAADEAMPEAPAQDSASGTVTENGVCIDHSHRFAEGEEGGRSTGAYCGNMEATIDVAGERFTITGTDAVKVTDILIHLDYNPDQVCRCMAEFTVDTEMLSGIHVNLTQGFARCERGQAALTEEQARILQDIIDRLLS